MNADHLTFVYVDRVSQEQTAATLQVKQRVGGSFAFEHAHQYAVLTLGHIAFFHWTVVVKDTGHNARTGSESEEQTTESDQATRRHDEFQTHTAFAVWLHICKLGFTQTQLFHDGALMRLFHIDNHLLVRLLDNTVNFFLDNFWTRNTHFETFTTHGFDQYRQVQFTTPRNDEFVWGIARLNTQSNVVDKFLVQTIFDVSRGDELAFFTGERRIVHDKGHAYGWLINTQGRQSFNIFWITQGVGDAQAINAIDTNNVTRSGQIGFDLLKT